MYKGTILHYTLAQDTQKPDKAVAKEPTCTQLTPSQVSQQTQVMEAKKNIQHQVM